MATLIETQRLRLRQLSDAASAFMLALLNDPSFIQNIGDRGVRTLEDAAQYISRGAIQSFEKYGYGLYLVELKDSGVSIGICGLVKRDALPHTDVGFAFFPQYWRNGYNYESATSVINYARDTLRLPCLLGITSSTNFSSIRVLEKLGLSFKETTVLPGAQAEVHVFEINLEGLRL